MCQNWGILISRAATRSLAVSGPALLKTCLKHKLIFCNRYAGVFLENQVWLGLQEEWDEVCGRAGNCMNPGPCRNTCCLLFDLGALRGHTCTLVYSDALRMSCVFIAELTS